jgi:hypothetical protein
LAFEEKSSYDAIFLRCAIAGFDLHTYFVLPGTHGDDLGQTSLHRIGRNDSEFLSCGAGDSAGEGEVAVYPE